ncbi:PTS transporter subunit IIC [Carnobacteriaceae bacterium zg-ZUI252]|nr:PTS transporter subunit IIC [Carnobacteriaceae bacterium zg-ZUI252]
MNTEKISGKDFFNRLLAGTALGVIIGLIPNAVLSAILKYFSSNTIAAQVIQIAVIFQLATPLIIGALIGLQFKFKPLQTMVVAGVSFVSSGVVKFDASLGKYVGAGTGDLINTMLAAGIAVVVLLWVQDKFGSVSIVALPIVVGCGVSFIGLMLLPFVAKFTATIGNIINTFTTFQPIIMSILIGCSFAFIIISPISTVAIGLAIQLNGVSAGAAAMGIAATTAVLVIHSLRVNKGGVTLAIALGAMKMMMPNLFKYPIILVPCLTTAIVSAIPVALFSISGVPSSAGFGLVGLVGPLASLDAGLNIALVAICWFVVPFVSAIATQIVFEKILKLYDSSIVFKFQG